MRFRRAGVFLLLLILLSVTAFGRPAMAQATVTHTVRAGENLFRIALYYGTTVDEIMAANGLTTVYIYVGQELVVPNPGQAAPPEAPLTPPPDGSVPTPVPTPAMPGLDARSYRVQVGDTLSGIAARIGVSTWALMRENGLTSWSVIYVGQELLIPQRPEVAPEPESEPEPLATPVATATPETPAATATPETPAATATPEVTASAETYTVQHGDTLTQIAARLGTTVARIAQLNGIANPSQIYVGQVLRLTGSAPVIASAGKLIVVSLSQQHLWAYQGDQLVYSFVASTGAAPSYTRAGEFRIQSKIPNAYGSTWNIWMPWWLGIYWAGSIENGIHALPIMANGQTLWAGYLGTPISYGCVVLGTQEAKLLYDWVEIGTPVSIRY